MNCDYCDQSYSTHSPGCVAITFGCADGHVENGRLEFTCLKHNDSHVAFMDFHAVNADGRSKHPSGAVFFREASSQCDVCFCSYDCAHKWWMQVFETFVSQNSSSVRKWVKL
jgi:hypothetical protein